MSFNTFGKIFRFTTWGESHGPSIGCVIDGCPPNIPISEKEEIWTLFANEWKINLNDLSRTITLNELDQEIESILKGGQVGRVIVSLGE